MLSSQRWFPELFNGTCSTWSPLLRSQGHAANLTAFYLVEKAASGFEERDMEGLMLLLLYRKSIVQSSCPDYGGGLLVLVR